MRRLRTVVVVVLLLALVAGTGGRWLMRSTTTQVAGELVERVETDEKVVALTFDDGPTAADADAVLSVLEDRGVHATFYVIGENARREPGTMRRLVDDGHEIGNHSWSHPRMVFLSPDEVAEQVESTDRAIRDSGYTGPVTFRPPYGKKLLVLPLYLAAHDRVTVTWDVAPAVGAGPRATDELVETTVEQVRPGSIVLLHPWSARSTTREAIGPIIDRLRERGYRFVTVSELIG